MIGSRKVSIFPIEEGKARAFSNVVVVFLPLKNGEDKKECTDKTSRGKMAHRQKTSREKLQPYPKDYNIVKLKKNFEKKTSFHLFISNDLSQLRLHNYFFTATVKNIDFNQLNKPLNALNFWLYPG